MLRRSPLSWHKLLIVESPNKVSKIQSILSQTQDWSFGVNGLKKVSSIPNETVTVIPTVGHFLELHNLLLRVQETPKELRALNVSAPATTAAPSGSTDEQESSSSKKKTKSKKTKSTVTTATASPLLSLQGTFSETRPYREVLLDWRPTGGKSVGDDLAQQVNQWMSDGLSEIILASDPDREGELIASHVYYTLLEKMPEALQTMPFSRAYIHSITEDGVKKAMQERRVGFLDEGLFRAAEVRHGMDRMFGFLGSTVSRTASPILRSVGRVQTPALIELRRREEKIASYLAAHRAAFSIQAELVMTATQQQQQQPKDSPKKKGKQATVVPQVDAPPQRKTVTLRTEVPGSEAATLIDATSSKQQGEPLSEEAEQAQLQAYIKALDLANAHHFALQSAPAVSTLFTQPPRPLTMASVILDANKKWRMSSEAVAKGLQDLFQAGYITYPRTDSTRIDATVLPVVYDAVVERFGKSSLWTEEDQNSAIAAAAAEPAAATGGKKKQAKSKKGKKAAAAAVEEGNAEHAHEAIRPTSFAESPENIVPLLSSEAGKLYMLIYNTTLASFMKPQQVEKITAAIQFQSGSGATLSTKLEARREVDAGFRKAFQQSTVAQDDKEAEGEGQDEVEGTESLFSTLEKLPSLMATQAKTASSSPLLQLTLENAVVQKSKPNPPPLHSEGSLIEELRRNGVGRPSTYPSIMRTLLTRGYVTVNDKGKCEVTETGKKLVEFANRAFPSIVDIAFTAKFERTLDAIAASPKEGVQEGANAVSSSFLSDLLEMIGLAVCVRQKEIFTRSFAIKYRRSMPDLSEEEVQQRAMKEAEIQFAPRRESLLRELQTSAAKCDDFSVLQNIISNFTRRNFPAY